MRWLSATLDRLFFTLAAVTFIQLPGFIEAYLQRLGGHLDEARLKLETWQSLAGQHYRGDLQALIASYQSSLDPAIRQTGEIVQQDWQRVEYLQGSLEALSGQPLWQQLWQLPMYLDTTIATNAWTQYTWTIPLDWQAALTALAAALVLTTTVRGLGHLLFRPLGRRRQRGAQPGTSYL